MLSAADDKKAKKESLRSKSPFYKYLAKKSSQTHARKNSSDQSSLHSTTKKKTNASYHTKNPKTTSVLTHKYQAMNKTQKSVFSTRSSQEAFEVTSLKAKSNMKHKKGGRTSIPTPYSDPKRRKSEKNPI